MTAIKADRKDKDAIAKICALHDIEVYFLENIEGDMMHCVIYSDSPSVLFHLGRSVQLQVEINELKTA